MLHKDQFGERIEWIDSSIKAPSMWVLDNILLRMMEGKRKEMSRLYLNQGLLEPFSIPSFTIAQTHSLRNIGKIMILNHSLRLLGNIR
jgi:hypothetical protein